MELLHASLARISILSDMHPQFLVLLLPALLVLSLSGLSAQASWARPFGRAQLTRSCRTVSDQRSSSSCKSWPRAPQWKRPSPATAVRELRATAGIRWVLLNAPVVKPGTSISTRNLKMVPWIIGAGKAWNTAPISKVKALALRSSADVVNGLQWILENEDTRRCMKGKCWMALADEEWIVIEPLNALA